MRAIARASANRRRVTHRDEVVDQLHLVAQPERAQVNDVAGPAAQHRLDGSEGGVVAADHGVERAFLGFLGRARQRCIDQRHAGVLQFTAEREGRDRVRGRAVDDDQALPAARDYAVRSAQVGLDLRRAGDAQVHDVALRREFARRPGFRGAERLEMFDGLALAVAEHDQRMALGDEVPGHAVAHQADADEAHGRLHGDRSWYFGLLLVTASRPRR